MDSWTWDIFPLKVTRKLHHSPASSSHSVRASYLPTATRRVLLNRNKLLLMKRQFLCQNCGPILFKPGNSGGPLCDACSFHSATCALSPFLVFPRNRKRDALWCCWSQAVWDAGTFLRRAGDIADTESVGCAMLCSTTCRTK